MFNENELKRGFGERYLAFVREEEKRYRALCRDEGRAEGRAEGEAHAVLTALRIRGIPVPDAVRERILAEKDPARLERWLERAVLAASVAEVVDDPS